MDKPGLTKVSPVITKTVATTETHPRWEALLKYLPPLDPGRVEHAFRVALAVTISYFLSLYLFPYKSGFWPAVSALIVLSMFLGTTLNKAVHRLAGNTAGVVAGLFLLSTVSQDRLAGTIAFSLPVHNALPLRHYELSSDLFVSEKVIECL